MIVAFPISISLIIRNVGNVPIILNVIIPDIVAVGPCVQFLVPANPPLNTTLAVPPVLTNAPLVCTRALLLESVNVEAPEVVPILNVPPLIVKVLLVVKTPAAILLETTYKPPKTFIAPDVPTVPVPAAVVPFAMFN